MTGGFKAMFRSESISNGKVLEDTSSLPAGSIKEIPGQMWWDVARGSDTTSPVSPLMASVSDTSVTRFA